MSTQLHSPVSPSVSLDIEAPDVHTPAISYDARRAFGSHLQTYFQTLQKPHTGTPEAHGQVVFSPSHH